MSFLSDAALGLPAPPRVAADTGCVGACVTAGVVTAEDLILGLRIALGLRPPGDCPALQNADGRVDVAQLLRAVDNVLNDCRPGPSPTPTATRTPSRPTTATLTPAPVTVTSTPIGTTTVGATATASATMTPLPVGFTLLSGRCEIPDPQPPGRSSCPAGTAVRVLRCNNIATCVQSEASRTAVGMGTTDASGQFAIVAATAEVQGRRLLFVASLGEIVTPTPLPTAIVTVTPTVTPTSPLPQQDEFAIIDFGAVGAQGLATLQARDLSSMPEMVIGPDSSGVVSAADSDGLDSFTGKNLTDLVARLQALNLNYQGDTIVSAKAKARDVATNLIDPQYRFATSTDGRTAYFMVLNATIFDYAITTMVIDGGSGKGANSCGQLPPDPGGAAVGDDVPDADQIQTTPLLKSAGTTDVGDIAFIASGQGRVCPGCPSNAACRAGSCMHYAIDDQTMTALSAGLPGLPAATKVTLAALDFGTCTLNGDAYGFGVGGGLPTTTLHLPSGGPTDGFRLTSDGGAVVFASTTTINQYIGFGIGGFRLDRDSHNVIKGLDFHMPYPSARMQLNFATPPPTVAIGGYARALAVRDLNGDAQPDLAIADDANDRVNVLLHQAGGTYSAPASYAVGSSPVGIAIADVDGDGHLDIVTANNGSADVSILRGSAGGLVATATSIAVSPFPVALAVGSLDGGTRPDIVTAHEPDGLSVLINDGSGGFTLRTYPGGGSYPSAIAVADLDGVHGEDVVTADEGSGTVSVWLSAPGGVLSFVKSYPAVNFPGAVVLANFDRDPNNLPDIAVASQTDSVVAVFFNQGNATFGPPAVYRIDPTRQCVGSQPCPAGLFPTALAVGGLDNVDGRDLVVANASGDVAVLLNQGDGSFDPPRPFAAAEFPIAVGVAEVSGNGPGDVVVLSENTGIAALLEH